LHRAGEESSLSDTDRCKSFVQDARGRLRDYEEIPVSPQRFCIKPGKKARFRTRIDAKALYRMPVADCGDYKEIPKESIESIGAIY